MSDIKPFIRYEIGIVLALLVASAAIIWQFFTPLLLALITAYILYPIVSRVQKWVYFYDAALAITIFVLLFPLIALLNFVAGDVTAIVNSFSDLSKQVSGFFVAINNYVTYYGLEEYTQNLPNLIDQISKAMQAKLINNLSNLPHILLSIVIYLTGTYFMLRDGYKAKDLLMRYSNSMHFRDMTAINNFFNGLKNSFDVLFFVHIGLSLLSAILAGVGFYLFGVPYPAIFTLLVAIFGFLPLLGAWLGYGGAALMHYLSFGNSTTALIVFFWGLTFSNILPDFVIKPWMGAKVGKVHPMTILMGFVGGPFVFGFLGFILGPIILVIAETVLKGFIELHTELNKAEKAKKQQ